MLSVHEKALGAAILAEGLALSPKYFLARRLSHQMQGRPAGSACSFPFLSSLFPEVIGWYGDGCQQASLLRHFLATPHHGHLSLLLHLGPFILSALVLKTDVS